MVAKGARDRRSSSSTNATTTSNSSTKRRVSSTTQEKKKVVKPIGICGFCLGDNEKNANGIVEEMIHCAECGNSGHPSCLQYSDRLVQKIRTINWQCIDCKRCIICNKSDDSLLFCDFCDAGIHPKCCDPPLHNIPKGDFACHLCRNDISIETNLSSDKTLVKSLSSSSSIRSRRSVNEDETPPVISRPVAQLIDGMSNFFLPNKAKTATSRQQSVQKAVKYLREKKNNNHQSLKRLQSSLETKSMKENTDLKNQLLAKSILASSKTPRIKKKPLDFPDDLPSNPQTSTPLLMRQSTNRKSFIIEPITPSPRPLRRSETQPIEELTNSRRKHSTNSISPISKKRSRTDSPLKKTLTKISSKKRKESQSDEEQSDDQEKKSTTNKRKLNLDLSKYKNVPAFLNDSLPEIINEHDIYLFLDARKNSTKLITECSEKFHHSSESIDDDANNTRWPPYIVFGSDLIKTWYSSSYPQEYARVPRLYICEFCLKYMKCEQVYNRHRKTCTAFHPPANEIYHKDDLSVFEVDGNVNRIYCQNLCLLAKLFLDHKTLYYDVEPFLFYVLTRNDSSGCHFIGYFSKEKHCPQKYNLSCITVLPNCQRRGYGRFLIELSYLISQKEGQVGTPERPLSTLGAQTYEAYWKIKLVELLLNSYQENQSKCVFKSMMNETAMASDDIIDTLQNLGVLTMKTNEKPVITVDITQFELILRNEKIKHAHWVSLDSEYLRFTPVLTPHLLTNEEKAVEKEVKEIQIVFKEIGRDAAEAAAVAAATATESTDGTEVVRYIRRRKFGQKRRSIYVKRRVPVANSKATKNDSMITHDDSISQDNITNDDDEHSQEYVSRRRISTIDESKKEEEEEQGEEEEEEVNQPLSPPLSEKIPSPPKTTSKEPILKQSRLDRFLKVVRPTDESNGKSIPVSTPEKININGENDRPKEQILTPRRRITRLTQLQPENEQPSSIINNETSSENPIKPDVNPPDTMTRQISESGLSTASSNDSFSMMMDRPLPLKKRVWNSVNLPTPIDPQTSSSKTSNGVNNDPGNLTRESSTSTTIPSDTPSSLADILGNPLLSSSSSSSSSSSLSTLGTDDEQKIARIESQLKTTAATLVVQEESQSEQISSINAFDATIKPVESIDDEPPPSLTSPTSMIVSQSNHYNYSTRNKQQPGHQHQTITINNFNSSTNMTYNFGNTSYQYSYPPAPSLDTPSYYYPPTTSMNYMPYYPSGSYPNSVPSMYPSAPIYNNNNTDPSAMFYPSNGVHPMVYNSNGTPTYPYPPVPPSSTASTTHHHL